MATIAVVKLEQSDLGEFRNSRLHVWETLLQGDDGAPLSMPDFADKTIQVLGTLGGATVNIEGSLDGVTWSLLTSPQGDVLAFTAADLSAVTELVTHIRPNISGGDGTTDIDVYFAGRTI